MAPPLEAQYELPASDRAEQSVLGGLLLDNTAWGRVADVVCGTDFYYAGHRTIFQQIADLIEDDRPADVLTVAAALEAAGTLADVGGQSYLGSLAANTPSAANIRRYAEIVSERATRRKIAAIGREVADATVTPGTDVGELLRDASARFEALQPLRGRSHALDWDELAQHDPEPPGFIVPGWMPEGDATLMAGHGGVGKSAIALNLAVCIALGLAWAGLPCAQRRVLYYCCEDNKRRLAWRLRRICLHLGISERDLKGHLNVDVMIGKDTVLWERDPRSGETLTPAYHALAARMRQFGAQVLFIDGISDTFGGNENSRTEVKRFATAPLKLVPADGALLLIGHVNRPTAAGGASAEGYSGSTQWHNAVRGRWYLYPEKEQDDEDTASASSGRLILSLQKIQDSGKRATTIGWRWDDAAHLFLPEAAPTIFDRQHRSREEQRGILLALHRCVQAGTIVPTALTGQRTAYHVLSARPEFPETLRSGKPAVRRFWAEIEKLRQSKLIEVADYRRNNRHGGEKFVPTTEGMRQCV